MYLFSIFTSSRSARTCMRLTKVSKTFNKLFFFTITTLERSKYLNKQLRVFLNVKYKNEVS